MFSYSPLLSWIMAEMNLTYAQAGFILPTSILMIILLRIPWGLLSDRIGFKLTMGLAITIMSFSGLSRGFAVNYWMLLMLETLFGAGVAAIMPCLPKLAAAWFPHEELGLATGIYVAGFSIGNMFGLSVTPYVLALLGTWRRIFLVYGLFGVVLALVWWVTAKEPTNDQTSLTNKAKQNTSLWRDLAAIVRMREAWILTGLFLCTMGSYDTICIWLPSILQLKGVPSVTAGLIAAMLPLGFLVASTTIGVLSDWAGLRKPFLWILGLISGPAILTIEKAQSTLLWGTVFLSGFCTMGIMTLVLMILSELPEIARFVASASGWISSLANIGSLIMPAVVGYVKDVTGSFLLGVTMIAVIAEATLVLGLMIKETGRKSIL